MAVKSARDHIRIVVSIEPETKILSVLLKSQDVICLLWPVN